MKANRTIWPIALVLVLLPALVLLDSSPAEAKKRPKPPPAVWAVTVPECGEAKCEGLAGTSMPCNLCGKEQLEYPDGGFEDGLGIRVTSGEDHGSTYSRFGFGVYRCLPNEACYSGEEAPLPIYLQGIELEEISSDPAEFPCQFPGPDGTGPDCRGLGPPDCLQCFLNGPHPHWADDTGEDYRVFSFEVTVFEYDYESSLPYEGLGYLSIEEYNTDGTLFPGDSDDHNIFGENVVVPSDVSITRPGSDIWVMDVKVTGPGGMRFLEWYRGCVRDPNPKGKCPSEYKSPLDTESVNQVITFQTTWTRSSQ